MKTVTLTETATRRQFLQGSSGLLLGFVLPGCRHNDPPEATSSRSNAAHDAAGFTPNAFIRIDREGLVTLIISKVEMGQGTFTSLPMLLAEELEVDLRNVKLEQAPADPRYVDPLLGAQVTGGSTSVRNLWEPLRKAGATARVMLVTAAAQTWGVDMKECVARNGVITHAPTGRSHGYGDLVTAASKLTVPQDIALKPPSEFKLIGTALKRLDTPEKVNGQAQFGIDARLPDMLIATVAACPVFGGKLKSVDAAKALATKGVRQVLKIEDAVAVVAQDTFAARQGLAALTPVWDAGPNARVTTASIVAAMDAASRKPGAIARNDGDASSTLAKSKRKLEAVYEMPFLAHATMEPMNCTVQLQADGCDLWVGTQSPTAAQLTAAQLLRLPPEKVRIHNHYLGGGFGRRSEADVIAQAVKFAQQVKNPVKFIWSREEDIQHDIYRPYYLDRISGALDDTGKPTAWSHRITGSSIFARLAPAFVKDGVDFDAVQCARDLVYDIANVRVEYVRHEPPVPTGFWRGVGATHNVWVVESFIDELAAMAGQDPLAYRRQLLTKSERMLRVLNLAADKAGWDEPLAAGAAGERVGRGIAVQFAFDSYLSQVAEVVVKADGEVRVRRVVCAVDCGQTVNPDTIGAQIESGVIFGLSAALWNEITLEQGRVQQTNYSDYRVMRLNEAPRIEVHIVKSSEAPGGIGETATCAIAPALTNAIFAATGKRIRKLPVTAALTS